LKRQFFKNVLHDQEAIWTAPFHMHQRDARWLVPGVLGTAALIATDRRTGDEIAESNGPLNASRIISYAGAGYGTGAVAATFYLVGRTTHNYRARETGVLAAEGMLDSAIVVTALKEVTQAVGPRQQKVVATFLTGEARFLPATALPRGPWRRSWQTNTTITPRFR
jgi:hypothetical protein